MKRNESRTGTGNRSAPQEPHCAHRNIGRGRGGKCGYGRRSSNVSSSPLSSILSSVLGGIVELADKSIRRLSTGLQKPPLLTEGSRKSETTLPDLHYRREDNSRTQTNTSQLTQNHEASELIADKQK